LDEWLPVEPPGGDGAHTHFIQGHQSGFQVKDLPDNLWHPAPPRLNDGV